MTQVAIQTTPGSAASSGCGIAPVSLSGIDFGVPSIGSNVDAVVKHFGAGSPDAKGNLSYASEVPVKEPKEYTVMQSLQYRVRGGVVTTISVSQVTTN